jgi:hypothetical protein
VGVVWCNVGSTLAVLLSRRARSCGGVTGGTLPCGVTGASAALSNLACARSSSFEKGRSPPRCIRSGESRPHGTKCRVPPLSLSERARASEREREGGIGRDREGEREGESVTSAWHKVARAAALLV